MSVLSAQQRDYFHTYGFLVLRGFLSAELNAELEAEVRRSLSENYTIEPSAHRRPATGDDSVFLPMMGPRTPVSRALVADERLVEIAQVLLGGGVIPKPAKGNFYNDASFWHSDSLSRDLQAIKVVTYFDALDGPSGALQVMPGSHWPDLFDKLAAFRAAWPWSTGTDSEAVEERWWPGQVLATQPGDVIIFDVHLWHASLGGRDRTQWSVSYVAEPTNDQERDAVRAYLMSFMEAGHEYNDENYPYFDPDWATDDTGPFARGLRAIDYAASLR
ncbi:phytanoyl-CoA dioxygenase family protein [Micromonospora aurantiaca (nom. illeg.)]|uniref:phytanoyl-CoA dioxygenase family protein n=1 Tax=Micromonospora aurantiaca (nom. illeg.) TaxID=47850 RepID=UPI0011AC11EB